MILFDSGLKPKLQFPVKQEKKEKICYGLGSPMQISPTEAVLFVNRRRYGLPIPDYEAGCDAIIFDNINKISAENAFPATRNSAEKDPQTGKDLIMMRYPISGGFVPLGAKLGDGRNHPHAGTGFGFTSVGGFHSGHSHGDPDIVFRRYEIQQYRYNGRRLEVVRTDRFKDEELLPSWSVVGSGISNAIPDGTDLIMGLQAKKSGMADIAGLGRWRYGSKGWQLVEFIPISKPKESEPSLVRDVDGVLLFCVRAWGRDIPPPKKRGEVKNPA